MPRRCCVPCCRSNYNSEKEYTSVFFFPKDDVLRSKWIKCINRSDFKPGSEAVVCIKHFEESMITREDRIKRDDGTELVVTRDRPVLHKNAVPTIFKNQPAYLTVPLPKKRKSPEERSKELFARDEVEFSKWCAEDNIGSFEIFKEKFHTHITPDWYTAHEDETVTFFKISNGDFPQIYVSLKINKHLSVQIVHNNVQLDVKTLEHILNERLMCDKWTKFDCLINQLNTFANEIEVPLERKLSHVVTLLNSAVAQIDDDVDSLKDMKSKIKFLSEQISLLYQKQIRYTTSTLLWSVKLFFSNPVGYVLLRNSKVITTPHPMYLKKLSLSLNCNETHVTNKHIKYLKKKAECLEDHEKMVNLLLDEIYVAPCLDYKAGTVIGPAENSDDEATTIQCFLIQSLLSKNKDVVSLIPTKNMDAEDLHRYTLRALQLLSVCGFTVISLISDNNDVNRSMFAIMGGGDIQPHIRNPYDKTKKLFFLFDTVHLFKSIRNNWLNQKCTNQTFFYPNVQNMDEFHVASVQHLRTIYDKEKSLTLKQAPKLSQKVLFPTSTERQNVSHVSNLFHDSNIIALQMNSESFGKDFIETKEFMLHILRWWKIVNVTHPLKGKHLRDMYCDPITGVNDIKIHFLKEFVVWLDKWRRLSFLADPVKQRLKLPLTGGMLSAETQFSLTHTTKTLIELVAYLFEEHKLKYVLLGKFQTDALEARFGQYRQMSGGNYRVSVRQVLESESKLKVLSLISLQSKKHGEFRIKDLTCKDISDSATSVDVPDVFDDIIISNGCMISPSISSVIVYVSGYVAKQVQRRIKCDDCSSLFSRSKDLDYELMGDTKYLELADRGGLKWPTNLTVSIVTLAYQVFSELISETYEEQFLRCTNQKDILAELVTVKWGLSNVFSERCKKCGDTRDLLVQRCMKVMGNILLNNYCKEKNDKPNVKTCNKRKLSTLNS